MGYLSHVVRRGLDSPSTVNLIKRAVQEGPKLEIPKWGAALIITTFVVFTVFLSLLEYTLKDVVATLAMVETPSAAITVSPSSESGLKDTKENNVETGPTITLVHQKPITTSIRGTIRHLVAQAGTFSRWRAILSSFVYRMCYLAVFMFFHGITPRFPGHMVFVAAISGALTANLHAAWTHKVIAMPTEQQGFFKRVSAFFKRIPARSSWKQLAVPAAVNVTASQTAVYIAHGAAVLMGLDRAGQDNFVKYSGAQWLSVLLRTLSVFAIGMIAVLFIVLPAAVTQIRVEASLLPEDKDTIVPFDRTFSGKVVPKILGGTGAIGFIDAWRSFNWEARRRLVKLYIKFYAIVTVLFIAFAHILAFEVWAIMGPALGKFLAEAQREGFMQ